MPKQTRAECKLSQRLCNFEAQLVSLYFTCSVSWKNFFKHIERKMINLENVESRLKAVCKVAINRMITVFELR